MFEWNALNFLWIILASICAGFGWTVGDQLAASTVNLQTNPRAGIIILIIIVVILLVLLFARGHF